MDFVDPILLEKNMQPGGRNDVLFQMNDAIQKSKIIARKRAEQQEREILGETGMIRKSKLVNTNFFGNPTEVLKNTKAPANKAMIESKRKQRQAEHG